MMRRTLAISLALAGLVTGSAVAAESTLSYAGFVTRASGPHASLFLPGQAINIRYVVDDAIADSLPDPVAGHFGGALVELRIGIPAAGVDAVAGPGTVQTFNDFEASTDQVFFYAPATAGQLAGVPIMTAEVDFLAWSEGGADVPVMLSSDALPTSGLVTDDSFALFRTVDGTTFVHFLAEAPAPSVEDLVTDGGVLIDDLRDDGRLHGGHASALGGKLDAVLAAFDAGDFAEACGTLGAFDRQLAALERAGRISATTADELRAVSAALNAAIGC